ncbi:hypothetical protein [Planobispora longispora]|uniref:Uncharacterized protein n=1 Tax=Planobispora longispora TaxID=28887 RepID=A0A8J3W559_9ACTN|nr:hypothetical protein [Planobispora longispora]BFE84680.1 hypothetical protein GCM10020093_072810 [Planobispora longispora]GIH75526.1 hypothetical protein Plo01_19550 [Planobispora longispora]
MVEAPVTERMSSWARAAQVIMMLQAAFGVVAGISLLVLLSGAQGGGIGPVEAGLLFAGIVLVLLTGWTAGRWNSRRAQVWTASVVLEGLILVGNVSVISFDAWSDFEVSDGFALLIPAAAFLMLLLPSTKAWFDR